MQAECMSKKRITSGDVTFDPRTQQVKPSTAPQKTGRVKKTSKLPGDSVGRTSGKKAGKPLNQEALDGAMELGTRYYGTTPSGGGVLFQVTNLETKDGGFEVTLSARSMANALGLDPRNADDLKMAEQLVRDMVTFFQS
jgi:hypothetical protein